MIKYNISKIEKLKEFIYYSNIHDAIVKYSKYDLKNNCFTIKVANYSFNIQYTLKFYNIEYLLFTNTASNNSNNINTLVVSKSNDNNEVLNELSLKFSQNNFYFIFEMFFDKEIHIICESIGIITSQPRLTVESQ